MISAAVIEALKEIVPAERILFQEPMKLHTTFRIGGPADYLIYLENEDQLCRNRSICAWWMCHTRSSVTEVICWSAMTDTAELYW